MRAAELETSLSELVNYAVRYQLIEDADDLAVARERAGQQPDIPLAQALEELRRPGKL